VAVVLIRDLIYYQLLLFFFEAEVELILAALSLSHSSAALAGNHPMAGAVAAEVLAEGVSGVWVDSSLSHIY
jgi:hypothetical protein